MAENSQISTVDDPHNPVESCRGSTRHPHETGKMLLLE